jgi:serpin B
MRHITCGFLIASLSARAFAGGPPMSEVVRGNNRFALDLHAKLRTQPGNLFYSPASISMALAMTYAGARGETAEEMAKVLHFPADQDQLHASFATLRKSLNEPGGAGGYRLSVANRLWGQQGYHFLPDFLAITRESYAAELAPVDFAREPEQARRRINSWVEERTEGKIKDLVPAGVLDDLTRLVLTNAIYFKGDWTKPFPKAATKDDTFHVTSRKSTRVPLMFKRDDLRFWSGDGLKALELPYGKGELAAVLLLPDQIDGLPALEDQLTGDTLDRWLSRLRRRTVQVFLPRFNVTSAFSLRDVLRALGMKLAFDMDRADLFGISSQERLYISAAIHKAFVDVNEEGTEAAAATATVVAGRAVMPVKEPVTFRADDPFLFLIRDSRTGSILFLGRVVNPPG